MTTKNTILKFPSDIGNIKKISSNTMLFEQNNKYILTVSIDLHTYIIGHYNLLARITDLVSHTTYVVCVNFYTKVAGRTV